MKTAKIFFIVILSGWVFQFSVALATPTADLTYVEAELPGVGWLYDYTLFNASDPIADAGFDLYDLFLGFNPLVSFDIVSLPAGWDYNIGSGFVDTFSLNLGTPPAGTDIAPGTSLSGFRFQFSDRVGSLAYDVLLGNPGDPGNPVLFSGVSGPASAPIPEPATMLLVGTGLAGLVGFRRKFKK